ncbi:hypothetical protein [Brevundimonas goettingensis]|uniref:hypothetical protein n=1 Tax=Brevundimonas goettingensis TaxID=2774190 RepID=UPI001A9D6169|nr:hypothetical protein [Brevundimonas goettingensis]
MIDSLVAELIATGLVQGEDLAERIDRFAEGYEPASQQILKAFARSLRAQAGPMLTVIDGGLGGAGALPAAPVESENHPRSVGCDPAPPSASPTVSGDGTPEPG